MEWKKFHSSVAGGMKRREFLSWRDDSDEMMGYEILLGGRCLEENI